MLGLLFAPLRFQPKLPQQGSEPLGMMPGQLLRNLSRRAAAITSSINKCPRGVGKSMYPFR